MVEQPRKIFRIKLLTLIRMIGENLEGIETKRSLDWNLNNRQPFGRLISIPLQSSI